MKIKQLLTAKREEILMIAAKHGASNVRIFGSVVRGDDDEKSDIDLLIDYDLTKISPWFPSGLIQELQLLLDRKVDVVTVGGLQDRIREKVLQEAVKL